MVNNPDKSILERGDRRGKEIMVHCGKCKYIILVKKRSGWGGAVSKEAGKVCGATSRTPVSTMFAMRSSDFLLKSGGRSHCKILSRGEF